MLTKWYGCAEKIDKWVQKYGMTRFFTSYINMIFFYGIFLFLYELIFLREIVPVVHPFFIAWASFVVVYQVCVKRVLSDISYWQILFLFGIVAGSSVAANLEAGVTSNIKGYILSMLPLWAFYPVCQVEPIKENRKKVLLGVMSGAAVVIFVASAVADVMYLMHFGQEVTFMGITEKLGLLPYNDSNPGVLLYGIYVDTNHAAIYSIAFVVYSVWLFDECRKGLFACKWKNAVGQIFAVANFVVQICYYPLANSRGAFLSLGISCVIILFLYFKNHIKWQMKAGWKILYAVAVSVCCTALCIGGMLVLRTGLSYASAFIQLQQEKNIEEKEESTLKEPEVLDKKNTNKKDTNKKDTNKNEASKETNKKGNSSTSIGKVQIDSFEKKNQTFGAGRVLIWKEVPELLAKKALLGTGYGNYEYFAMKYDVAQNKIAKGKALHNGYFDLLLSNGVLGFSVLMCFFGVCGWKVLSRLWIGGKKVNKSYYSVVFLVIVIAAQAILLSNLFINTTAMYFMLMIMVGFLMTEKEE